MLRFFPNQKKLLFLAAVFLVIAAVSTRPFVSSGIKFRVIKLFSLPRAAARNISAYFRSKKSLVKENKDLRKKEAELSLSLSAMKDKAEENERLRKLLDFKKSFKIRTVAADVVMRDINDWALSFVINKGAADGVSRHAAVCSSSGLIGRVAAAGERESFVILLTHPDFRAGGVIKRSRVNGVVAGGGRNTVRMLYIPFDADVMEGDEVVTSEFSRIFPKGIGIGRVASVHKSGDGLYKYAVIKPSSDLGSEEEVLCVLT